jgi:hypothetical protein
MSTNNKKSKIKSECYIDGQKELILSVNLIIYSGFVGAFFCFII